MWCMLFGVGKLLWGKLVKNVKKRKIKKIIQWGSGKKEEYKEEIEIGEEKFDND